MRIFTTVVVLASGALTGVALANGHDVKCFDKGALSYFECPKPATWAGPVYRTARRLRSAWLGRPYRLSGAQEI